MKKTTISIVILLFFSTTQAEQVDGKMNANLFKVPLQDSAQAPALTVLAFAPPRTSQSAPLLIMNHSLNGVAANNIKTAAQRLPEAHYYMAREFISRGYFVANPARQGRGGSDGAIDSNNCDIAAHARREAGDIAAVVRYAVKDAAIDKNNILLAGQSHGAVLMLAMLAYYPEEAKHIKGAISFSGGVLLSSAECPWKRERITSAYEQFGKAIKLPSLWLHTKYDSLFKPDYYKALFDAYTAAGGKATLTELVQADAYLLGGHNFINWRTSVSSWWPSVEKYLISVNAPTKQLHTVLPRYKVVPSGHAAITDMAKFPMSQDFSKYYQDFLRLPMPRALVISLSDPVRFTISVDHQDSLSAAVSQCINDGGKNCQPYAIDDVVVYKPEHAKETGTFFK